MSVPREPTFMVGDRVKLWGKSKDVGAVDEVFHAGSTEMVTVVWETTGCASDVRAHRLQFAPLPRKED